MRGKYDCIIVCVCERVSSDHYFLLQMRVQPKLRAHSQMSRFGKCSKFNWNIIFLGTLFLLSILWHLGFLWCSHNNFGRLICFDLNLIWGKKKKIFKCIYFLEGSDVRIINIQNVKTPPNMQFFITEIIFSASVKTF